MYREYCSGKTMSKSTLCQQCQKMSKKYLVRQSYTCGVIIILDAFKVLAQYQSVLEIGIFFLPIYSLIVEVYNTLLLVVLLRKRCEP